MQIKLYWTLKYIIFVLLYEHVKGVCALTPLARDACRRNFKRFEIHLFSLFKK